MARSRYVSCAVCSLCCLVFILIWIGAFIGFGVSSLVTPSKRPANILEYNQDATYWEANIRSKFLALTPQPTVKLDSQLITLNKDVNAVDKPNDSPQNGEEINSNYAQLRLKSDQTQLFASGAWNPAATKLVTIKTGVEEKQYSVALMITQTMIMTENKSNDRSVHCRNLNGYYKGDRQCVLFFYLSGICALVDSTTGRLATLPGAAEPGCGLVNPKTRITGNYDFSIGEYKQAPAGYTDYSPANGNTVSNGYVTIRDVNDPYIRLGYRTGYSFSFGMTQGQQTTVGVVLLVLGLGPGICCILALIIGGIRVCVSLARNKSHHNLDQHDNYEMVANAEHQQPLMEGGYDPQQQQQQPGAYQPYQPAPQYPQISNGEPQFQ